MPQGPDRQGTGAIALVLGVMVALIFMQSPEVPAFARVALIVLGGAVALWGLSLAVAEQSPTFGLMLRMMWVLLVLGTLGIALAASVAGMWPDGADIQLLAASIAAIAVGLGWLASPMMQELRRSEERDERRRDLLSACVREIASNARFAAHLDCKAAFEEVRAQFDKDEDYKVFVLFQRDFTTLRRLVAEIDLLRTSEIQPVLDAYQLMIRLEQIEVAMLGEAFANLPIERRQKAVEIYYNLLGVLPEESITVLEDLNEAGFAASVRETLDAQQLQRAGGSNEAP